jgi:hypothetical protein
MKIVEAHQVPYGNVSPDIFALPCVNSARKKNGIEYGVFVNGKFAYPSMAHAFPTDWICKTEDGKWIVFNNEEYEEATEAPK